MSSKAATAYLDFVEEFANLSSRFFDVSGVELGMLCDSDVVIKHYLEVIIHGELFEGMTTDPLDDAFSVCKIPTDMRDSIRGPIKETIREKLMEVMPEHIAEGVMEQKLGYSAAVTKVANLTYVLDALYNEEETAWHLQQLR